MPDRQGISCNELINTTPVRVVYCGYRDPEHQEVMHNDFDIRFTDNRNIEQMCKQFADMFQKQNLREGTDPDLKNKGNAFVKFVKDKLEIDQLPKIHMVAEIGSSEHPTFGLFDPNTNTIRVAYRGRHIMDVLRTLAHELTHHKQREENRIKPDSGETGSEIENEANAQAGVLMRDFADQNPELF
jgi:Zn-dependent peptidase ImmA (M78 family)